MFENIICQDEVVSLLREDWRAGRLPAAMLFAGPDFSGKLSAALELARGLGCEGGADWRCECRSCAAHRLLAHPYTAFAGGRYFYEEALACANTLRRAWSVPGRFLFIRSVRKLLRRFDAHLWEGEEARLHKIMPSLVAAEEALQELSPEREGPPPEKRDKFIEGVLGAVAKITEGASLDSIPIKLIRRLSAWAHVGAGGAAKVIIMENADRMLEGSRNALLKILEEPPGRVTFILTTSRRAAILPTILSRVRTYQFAVRGEAAQRNVLTKIFREEEPSVPLKDFFRDFQDAAPDALRAAALRFLMAARTSPPEAFPSIVQEHGDWFQDRRKFRFFLYELFDVFRRILGSSPEGGHLPPSLASVPLEKLEEWTSLLRRSLESLDVLNMAPSLLAQRLYCVFGRP
ncbi:MAG: DNA polymerase III [Spirochaetales bacterium]|jgi:DNA polymerase-3 subunit gamma/tau|nr:DNA polymerase III [Spirochaetales bacterium]